MTATFRSPVTAMFMALTTPALCLGADTPPTTVSSVSTSGPAVRMLPNQWSLNPAGQNIPLGDFPAALAVSPDGRWGAVVHCGYGDHEVRILDLPARREAGSAKLRNAFSGLAWAPDGKLLYVSRGADDTLARFEFRDGELTDETTIVLRLKGEPERGLAKPLAPLPGAATPAPDAKPTTATRTRMPRYPAGIAIAADGATAYVSEMYANRVLRVDLGTSAGASAADAGDTRTLRPPVSILARFEGDRSYPHRLALHPKRPILYASLWGGSAVAEVSLTSGTVERIPTDPHPNEIAMAADGSRMFVACANSNLVDEIDTTWRTVIQRLETALYPNGPPAGSTPDALALTADGALLLVANADNNNLAAFNVERAGLAQPIGYIPTGWYPTGVGFDRAGDIVAINGKGDGSLANPDGPKPDGRRGDDDVSSQYIGGLMRGTASFIPRPKDKAALWAHTQAAYAASPLRGDFGPVGMQDAITTGPKNPIPRVIGEDLSPIRHVVYIIKENRTYDQVFGDMPEGNGDPDLCLFGEDVTPNHHALAREFVLLDNFYCEAEVSADGHEWSMGAYATDYVERTWPPSYGKHGRGLPYPAEGSDPVGEPPAGHLWDRAEEAGITYRSYGEWVDKGGPKCDGVAKARALVGHIDPCFASYYMDVLERDRAARFLKELDTFNREAVLPALTIIRLPNDHTVGTKKGKRTPRAYVAEHDQALGEVIEGLSRSRFWKAMAVFVVEDDAQNGADHVDAHRSPALLAGPFVKRGHVDHTMYSTSSVLRTIELILGLKPMSQFDAAARPMDSCFTGTPDTRPYANRPARVSQTELNPDNAPMQNESAMLDFTKEDANPDVHFNRIIWKSVKGAGSEPPPPVRAAFVRPVKAAGGADADGDGE